MKSGVVPAIVVLLVAPLHMTASRSASGAAPATPIARAAAAAPDAPEPAEPATIYPKILRDIDQYIALHGPVRVRTNFNPKAPVAFQAQYDFVMYSADDHIGMISYRPEEGVRYILKLKPDNMVFFCKTTQGISEVAPLSDRDFRAPTGAGTLAARHMFAAVAPVEMQNILGDNERADLSAAQTLELSRTIYPDQPIRSPLTRLEQRPVEEGTELIWGDFGRAICKAVVAPVEQEELDELRATITVDRKLKRAPMPRLEDLMQYLAANGFPNAGQAPVHEFRGGGEMSGPFTHGEVESILSLGPTGPFTGAGAVVDFELAPQQLEDVTVLRVLEGGEPMNIWLVPHGQDWAITYDIYEPSSEVEEQLTPFIVNWIREYRRTAQLVEKE